MFPKKNTSLPKKQTKKKPKSETSKNELHNLFFAESNLATENYDGSKDAKNYSYVVGPSGAQFNMAEGTFNMRREDFPNLPGSSNEIPQEADTEKSGYATNDSKLDDPVPSPENERMQFHPDGRVTNIPESVMKDQYGLVGLATVLPNDNLDQTMLCKGVDLKEMGLNLNSDKKLLDTFRGALDDIYGVQDELIYLPQEYKLSEFVKSKLKPLNFKTMSLETLFYFFYTYTLDQNQILAAEELYARQWRFHKGFKVWARRSADISNFHIVGSIFSGEYDIFNVETFSIITKHSTVDESLFADSYC